jgi:hypothetical protein
MTETIITMLNTHPARIDIDQRLLAECVAACSECAQTCTACADACLSEEMVADLTTCIRTNLDCADVCETTGRVLSRHTGYGANLTRAVLQVCAQASKSCGDERVRHADMHEHCRICAEPAGGARRPVTAC